MCVYIYIYIFTYIGPQRAELRGGEAGPGPAQSGASRGGPNTIT